MALLAPGACYWSSCLVAGPLRLHLDVPGGSEWRFTLHAYPFYLVAAARFLTGLRVLTRPMRLGRSLWNWRRTVVPAVVGGVLVAVAGWWLAIGLRYLRFREDVRTGEAARFEAGPRDRMFVGNGWYAPTLLGNVRVRFSHGRQSILDLPLTADGAMCGPCASTRSISTARRPNGARLLNARRWRTCASRDDSRIGTYTVALPAAMVREGENRLELQAADSTRAASVGGGAQEVRGDRDVAFLFWYLRVEPAPSP